jgi:SAM-dependent methyltransferase
MSTVDGAKSFLTSGDAYFRFMGRYSQPLAPAFADAAGVGPGDTALDVGCGPGALTMELVARLGAGSVHACDPSPPFVAACAARNPGAEVTQGRAENLPYEGDTFDVVLAQLVMHFVSEPAAAVAEMTRVVRPGGRVAVCVWDFERGMEMLRAFWDAAVALDPEAPDELRVMHFGRAGELLELLDEGGLGDVTEEELTVTSDYADFDELWNGFLAGIGPAGSYLVGLPESEQARLREKLYSRLGSPTGGFTLDAVARAAVGTRTV